MKSHYNQNTKTFFFTFFKYFQKKNKKIKKKEKENLTNIYRAISLQKPKRIFIYIFIILYTKEPHMNSKQSKRDIKLSVEYHGSMWHRGNPYYSTHMGTCLKMSSVDCIILNSRT